MKALILAAGRGRRLSQTKPKPLTTFLGYTLIERTILSVREQGITDFVIVVGYKYNEIKKYLGSGKRLKVKIKYVNNPEWKKENGLSVLKAKEIIGNEDFILLMSDHVFDYEVLGKLLNNKGKKCILLIDRNVDEVFDKDDATKLQIKNGEPRKIGKNLSKYNAVDCGIFYCTKDLFHALEKSTAKGKYKLSDAVQNLIDENNLLVVDIEKKFWCDIDTPQSFKYAEKKMLQSLVKPTDGPISKHFNRKISTRISKRLVKTNITPNQLSIAVFALAIFSAIFFFFMKNFSYLLIGGLLCQLSSILDGCDGEVARLKFMKSAKGGFIDSVLDRYADSLIIIGLCYGYWYWSPSNLCYGYWLPPDKIWIWIAGVSAITGTLIFSYTNARHEAVFEGQKSAGIPIRRDVRLFIIMLGAFTMQIMITLIILALLTNIEIVRRTAFLSTQDF